MVLSGLICLIVVDINYECLNIDWDVNINWLSQTIY